MKTPALTKLAKTALEDLKGQDLLVMDVRQLTAMTDTMILCTGTSTRHVKALAQSVVEQAKANGIQPLGQEGLDQGEWALVDLNGVLVHVMQAQVRAFYQLEKLWQIEPPTAEEAAAKEAAKAAKKAVKKAAKTEKAAPRSAAGKAKAAPRKKATGTATKAKTAVKKAAAPKKAVTKAAVAKAPKAVSAPKAAPKKAPAAAKAKSPAAARPRSRKTAD